MHRIMSHDMHEIPLTYRGFEGVSRKERLDLQRHRKLAGSEGMVPHKIFQI